MNYKEISNPTPEEIFKMFVNAGEKYGIPVNDEYSSHVGEREDVARSYGQISVFDVVQATPNRVNFIDEVDKSLLEQTPENERYYLQKETLIKGRSKKYNAYRGGFCFGSDPIIVRRIKDEKGKWIVKKGLHKYQALTRVNFFYMSQKNGEERPIELHFDPGETFYAAKTGEDNEKRKMMLKNQKTN